MNGLGEHEGAFEIITGALDAKNRVFGPSHPLVYEPMEILAENYGRRGQLHEAIQFQRHAFNGALDKLGDKSLVAARTGANLSLMMSRNGQYSEAETHQKIIVDRLRTVYGKTDPNTLRAEDTLQRIRIERASASAKRRAHSQLLSSPKTTISSIAGQASNLDLHKHTYSVDS